MIFLDILFLRKIKCVIVFLGETVTLYVYINLGLCRRSKTYRNVKCKMCVYINVCFYVCLALCTSCRDHISHGKTDVFDSQLKLHCGVQPEAIF